MTPTIGDIVLYTFPSWQRLGQHHPAGQARTVPAIVVNVWDDNCINLRVIIDGPGPELWATSVVKKEPDTDPDSEFWEFKSVT